MCKDFNLRNQRTEKENVKKPHKIIFFNTTITNYKTAGPHS